MSRVTSVGIHLVLGAYAVTVAAHHSYSVFDMTTTRTVEGTIRALEWGNPHVWLWVDVTDASGKAVSYGFETVSPGQLARDYGWSRSSLQADDRVKVEYAPLRSGAAGGALRRVILPDGRVLATRLTQVGQ
jgi:hypothetical protein